MLASSRVFEFVSRTPQSHLTVVATAPQCGVEFPTVDTEIELLPQGGFLAQAAARNFVCPQCRRPGTLGGRCATCRLFHVSARSLELAPPRSWLGHMLADRFAVLGLLGSGGMGVVYWAVQHPVGRLAAVKVLRSDLTGSVVQERFLREARTIAGLQHPHVITCFDYGLHGDRTPYMALELLHGISLEHCADEVSLDLPTVAHIMAQVLEGIAAFHEAGIVHRDLKPDNVMLCRIGGDDTFVKIIDFGLALRLFDAPAEKLTQGAEVFGTPLFMSPEQAVGSGSVGPPSDVYSLGIILYELLTGRVPFTASAAMKVMLKHINERPPPLIPRDGMEVPPALEMFVLRCLEKDPTARYPDGRAALDAFRALGLPDSGPVNLITSGNAHSSEHSTVAFAQSAQLALDLPDCDTIDLDAISEIPARRVIELSWPPKWWDAQRFSAIARTSASRAASVSRSLRPAFLPVVALAVLALIVAGITVAVVLRPAPPPPLPPEIERAASVVDAARDIANIHATGAAVDQESRMRNAKRRLHH